MDHIFLIHLSVEGHFGSFHSLVTVAFAAMNIGYRWPFFSPHRYLWGKSEGEMNHERLWTLRNKLRVLEGKGRGGWVSLVVGIMEGTYCVQHWVWGINNEFWNTEKK